uniref:Uncharacterized protein n=1 Tax=Triparma pacifica TaxID=91992 RepID=A0A7S2QWA6_9STRA|mmetsp:Transcript_809/g.1455  ORF Transcript_809/g.1455 Transcript_809/m.1455 type:complete len:203 (+) Transcript_809:76-684(+)
MKILSILSILATGSAFMSPYTPSTMTPSTITQLNAIDQTQVGVLRPTGLFDPLNLMDQTEAFNRRRTSEIKHGRVAMVAVIGNLAPQLGLTFPGYLSTSENVKFTDVASEGSFAALAKIPAFGVFQILAFAAIMELWTWKQEKGMAPGDVGGRDWVRYQDDDVKMEKLNKELQNGRLAMLAIFGMMVQEQLTGKGVVEQMLG